MQKVAQRKAFEFGKGLTNGGIGHGFDTSDNSGAVAPGCGAQMAPQQKLGIRTERRDCGSSRNRVDYLDAWSDLRREPGQTFVNIRGKVVGAVIVGLMCAWANGCGSGRKPDVASDPAAQKSNADSSNRTSASSPISWDEIASSYERVADYVCLYEKTERVISKGEEQKIRFSFRKPFDVRLEWLDARGGVTQTAVYRRGFNDGSVLARQSGLLGSLAGTLQLDPNGSLALDDSSHPITEVGIGKIIERLQHDAVNPQITSHFNGEEVLDGKPAYKFELTANGNEAVGGLSDARKAFIWIDRELKLPVKVELYDAASGLLERHCFKEVRINQKPGDKTFTL
jgi:hypothetical protein